MEQQGRGPSAVLNADVLAAPRNRRARPPAPRKRRGTEAQGLVTCPSHSIKGGARSHCRSPCSSPGTKNRICSCAEGSPVQLAPPGASASPARDLSSLVLAPTGPRATSSPSSSPILRETQRLCIHDGSQPLPNMSPMILAPQPLCPPPYSSNPQRLLSSPLLCPSSNTRLGPRGPGDTAINYLPLSASSLLFPVIVCSACAGQPAVCVSCMWLLVCARSSCCVCVCPCTPLVREVPGMSI